MMFCLIFLIFLKSHVYSESCTESDLVIKSTDCDTSGNRWLFKIPRVDDRCDLNELSLPKKVKNCDKTCASGMHLDLLSQNCEVCPPGTFSKGDTFEVTKWDTIPEILSSDVTYGDTFNDRCNLTGWSPQGKYLVGKTTASCAIILSMKVYNLKPGTITFTYQIEEYGAMAFFTMRNERCSQLPGGSYLLRLTGPYAYETLAFSVPVGHNILQWYLFVENAYIQQLYGLKDPELHIKEIRLTGTPPVTTCIPCVAGSFGAHEKSDHCELCPRNTYSSEGASSCKPCSENEYSGIGSSSCSPRLPCVKDDYTSYWTPCDKEQMTQRRWKWIEPKICDENRGVSLPQPDIPIKCHECPIGTFPLDANTCELCSDSSAKRNINLEKCIKCPVDQVPIYGFHFDNWCRIPSILQMKCFNFFNVKCDAWERDMTSLRGGVGMHLDEVATLELPVSNGFITASPAVSLGTTALTFLQPPIPNTFVRIEFQLECSSRCRLSMKQAFNTGNEQIISRWTGTTKRMNFTYHVREASGTKFIWIFEKLASSNVHSSAVLQDHVNFFQIEVTNVKNNNPIGCQTCVRGIEHGTCKSCPGGLYYSIQYDEITKANVINCTKCPNNSIVVADASSLHTVDEACQQCESGTISVNHSVCITDTRPTLASGFQYDLTNVIDNPKMFTPSGTAYSHEFRINMAYGKTVRCIENSSNSDHYAVEALICRHTNLELSNHGKRKFYSKPTRLADRLVRLVASNVTPKFWQEINENLTKAGWEKDKLGNDLHYIFTSDDHSSNCPLGRTTVLTLRCLFTQDTGKLFNEFQDAPDYIYGKIELPPACPDGTCDGCTYHFLWLSLYACRLCTEEDYERILGECVYGHRKVHLRAPWECRVESGKNLTIIETCPLLTKSQMAAVLLTTFVLIILGLIIFVCYRRNKTLEYKYMKLVQSTSGKNQVTSCALEDNEMDNNSGNAYYNNNNIDSYNKMSGVSIKSPPSYTNSTGIVLEPSEFLQGEKFPPMGFKGLPKVNLPPIIYKTKADTDRDILTEDDQAL
ncbi:unnamed protein product [Heterobilharzia americana]|nr:unnamed protein product [Heterobilharzia americana]